MVGNSYVLSNTGWEAAAGVSPRKMPLTQEKSQHNSRQACSSAELISEGDGKLRELLHVAERELGVVDRVGGRVDVVVRQVKLGLNGKGRSIAGLGERGVVRAGVTALGLANTDIDCPSVLKEVVFNSR